MKVKEYYQKYGPGILTNNKVVSQTSGEMLLLEMTEELLATAKKQHAESDEAVQELITKQNYKWNRLVDMFKKHFCMSPLREDGFRDHLMKKIQNQSTEKTAQEEQQ